MKVVGEICIFASGEDVVVMWLFHRTLNMPRPFPNLNPKKKKSFGKNVWGEMLMKHFSFNVFVNIRSNYKLSSYHVQ